MLATHFLDVDCLRIFMEFYLLLNYSIAVLDHFNLVEYLFIISELIIIKMSASSLIHLFDLYFYSCFNLTIVYDFGY